MKIPVITIKLAFLILGLFLLSILPLTIFAQDVLQEKDKGTLIITSEPSDADIYINSKFIGKTPKTIKNLLPGVYKILITKENYADYQEDVSIEAGEVYELRVTLKQKVVKKIEKVAEERIPKKIEEIREQKRFSMGGNFGYGMLSLADINASNKAYYDFIIKPYYRGASPPEKIEGGFSGYGFFRFSIVNNLFLGIKVEYLNKKYQYDLSGTRDLGYGRTEFLDQRISGYINTIPVIGQIIYRKPAKKSPISLYIGGGAGILIDGKWYEDDNSTYIYKWTGIWDNRYDYSFNTKLSGKGPAFEGFAGIEFLIGNSAALAIEVGYRYAKINELILNQFMALENGKDISEYYTKYIGETLYIRPDGRTTFNPETGGRKFTLDFSGINITFGLHLYF